MTGLLKLEVLLGRSQTPPFKLTQVLYMSAWRHPAANLFDLLQYQYYRADQSQSL